MFRRMRNESNEKPDEATVVSTLSACTALEKLELGNEIDDYVRGELGLNVITGNALVNMLEVQSVVVWVKLGKCSMEFHGRM